MYLYTSIVQVVFKISENERIITLQASYKAYLDQKLYLGALSGILRMTGSLRSNLGHSDTKEAGGKSGILRRLTKNERKNTEKDAVFKKQVLKKCFM